LPVLQQEKLLAVKAKYGDAVSFARRFNPNIQNILALQHADYIACNKFDYPTLATIRMVYGDDMAVAWLKVMFDNLNDFAGTREKMTLNQINDVAVFFLSDCYFLNISEVAFFFLKFKQGCFGEFYGAVDPLRIMTAKKQFLSERAAELRRHEENLQNKEKAKQREQWAKTAVTYEQWKTTQAEHKA
jgi:hypothetical protein